MHESPPSEHRRRRHSTRAALIALGIVISAVFAYIAVRGAHPQQTLDALKATNYGWLVPSLGLLVLAFFIRAVRWQSLFARATRPPLRHVVSALFVGYLANAVLPVRAGEAAAIVALNKKTRAPVAEVTATMLVQRAQDVLSLALLLFLMLPWLPPVSWLRAAGFVALGLLVVLAATAALVIWSGDHAVKIVMRPLGRLPFVPAEALERAPAQFVRGLAGLLSPRIALVSFAWTTLSWVVVGASFWLVLKASGLPLSPLAGELVLVGIGLAMILPSSPAGLGVFEGATVVVLSAYGVSASEALSYALVLHSLNVLPLFAVAIGALLVRRLRRGTRARRELVSDPPVEPRDA